MAISTNYFACRTFSEVVVCQESSKTGLFRVYARREFSSTTNTTIRAYTMTTPMQALPAPRFGAKINLGGVNRMLSPLTTMPKAQIPPLEHP